MRLMNLNVIAKSPQIIIIRLHCLSEMRVGQVRQCLTFSVTRVSHSHSLALPDFHANESGIAGPCLEKSGNVGLT